MTRARAIFHGLAIVFATLGVVMFVWPARLPSGALSAVTPPPVGDAAGAPSSDPSLAQGIVAANIFSATRRPPSSRYVPSRDDAPAGIVADAGTVMPSDTAAAPAGDPVPHLYGTIVGPDGTQALLRLDASIPDPRLYHEGDSAGGYRVDAISERAVTLEGPRGRVVLRLTSPEDRAR